MSSEPREDELRWQPLCEDALHVHLVRAAWYRRRFVGTVAAVRLYERDDVRTDEMVWEVTYLGKTLSQWQDAGTAMNALTDAWRLDFLPPRSKRRTRPRS